MVGDAAEPGDKKAGAGAENPAAPKGKRIVSTIEFPYNDLETALVVARAVHDLIGAGSCDLPNLAVRLDHALDSGTFRLKVSAARMFALLTADRSSVTLTDLGRRLADGQLRDKKTELAEAFLSVELYRALYQRYEGYALPPAAALEREMVSLGVSEKQKDKARYAFDRSTKTAGFLAPNGRFIRPVAGPEPLTETTSDGTAESTVRDDLPSQRKNKTGVGGSDSDLKETLDPLVLGLLRRLPTPDRSWPVRERARWLEAMAVNLGIIYGPADAEQIDVTVRSEPDRVKVG
jgi:hypothetical protein